MQTNHENQNRTGTTDEAAALRHQLSALVKEVRCTIADPVRPQGLKDVLAKSQMMLN